MPPVTLPPPHPEWAYFLDIDGTLLAFAAEPGKVRVDQDLLKLVRRLSSFADGAVALITGRLITEVDLLFRAAKLPVAGQHGLERRSASGRIRRHVSGEDDLAATRQALAAVVARHPRLLLEDKGSALALHYRQAPVLAGYVHRVVQAEARRLGGKYRLLRGKRVVELGLSGRDKGMAIQEFIQERPFRGRTPVFLGDDVTDEVGFRVVNRLGGHSIKVGPGTTSAQWRLPDVKAVRDWLRSRARPARSRS